MAGLQQKQHKGKKTRKYERNKKWCLAYRTRGQREINKAKKLFRALRYNPLDKCAKTALEKLPAPHVKKARKELRVVGFKFAE
jgi:hypothetical protein